MPSNNQKLIIVELSLESHDDDILELAKQYASEVSWREEVDIATLKESCIRCRYDYDRLHSNCFMCYMGTRLVGILVGVTARNWHNTKLAAEQKLWYVVPSARSTRAGIMLMRAYDKWARLNGASQIFTGAADIACSEKTSHLLTKLGYPRVGSIHMKEI